MAFVVAFLGVHGVGKTTTARALGYPRIPVEAISFVNGLSARRRQTIFFVVFMNALVSAHNSSRRVVVLDNHPLQVLPYTEYFLGDGDSVLESMKTLIREAPRVNLLVLLDPRSTDTVVERVITRGRNVDEEARREYIERIIELTRKYYRMYGSVVAEEALVVPAELECDERVRLIRERIEALVNEK